MISELQEQNMLAVLQAIAEQAWRIPKYTLKWPSIGHMLTEFTKIPIPKIFSNASRCLHLNNSNARTFHGNGDRAILPSCSHFMTKQTGKVTGLFLFGHLSNQGPARHLPCGLPLAVNAAHCLEAPLHSQLASLPKTFFFSS